MARRPSSPRRSSAGPSGLAPAERAFQKVLRSASVREQSTATMRAKLAQAGFDEAVAEGALERAQACGFIDDRRYAEGRVRSALATGKGLRLVERELEELGVALEEVEAYQEHCEEGPSEVSRAVEALARKRFTAKNRAQAAWRFLVQRGYSPDAASSAVRLWIDAE